MRAQVVVELDPIDDHPSAVVLLQTIDTANQRALARAGRTDDYDDFFAGDLQVDVLQRLKRPEELVDVLHQDHRLATGGVAGSIVIALRSPIASPASLPLGTWCSSPPKRPAQRMAT